MNLAWELQKHLISFEIVWKINIIRKNPPVPFTCFFLRVIMTQSWFNFGRHEIVQSYSFSNNHQSYIPDTDVIAMEWYCSRDTFLVNRSSDAQNLTCRWRVSKIIQFMPLPSKILELAYNFISFSTPIL